MPGMHGLDGLDLMLKEAKPTRVAMMSGTTHYEVVQDAMAKGAAGFIPKTLPAKSLANVIHFMAMGETYVPANISAQIKTITQDHPETRELTEREVSVLKGLVHGKSNKEIARDMHLTKPTIKFHLKSLFKKIGVDNRTRAAMIGREFGYHRSATQSFCRDKHHEEKSLEAHKTCHPEGRT